MPQPRFFYDRGWRRFGTVWEQQTCSSTTVLYQGTAVRRKKEDPMLFTPNQKGQGLVEYALFWYWLPALLSRRS
jgi:hypothetical protein